MSKPVIYADRRLKWWERLIVAARMRIRPRKVREIEEVVHENYAKIKPIMVNAMIFGYSVLPLTRVDVMAKKEDAQ